MLSVADFSEFLKVIASQKSKTAAMDDESDRKWLEQSFVLNVGSEPMFHIEA